MDKNIEEPNSSKIFQFVSALCKGRTDEQLAEAEERLQGLLLVIKGICDRLTDEEKPLEIDKIDKV